MRMRFYPLYRDIQSDGKKTYWQPGELRPGNKACSIRDTGEYGSVTSTWLPPYERNVIEFDFDLLYSTWMLFDFCRYPTIGLYSIHQDLEFYIEDKKHVLEKGRELLIVDWCRRPGLFRFPEGKYKLFMLTLPGARARAWQVYFDAADKGKESIEKLWFGSIEERRVRI